jgi:hypothetical protein
MSLDNSLLLVLFLVVQVIYQFFIKKQISTEDKNNKIKCPKCGFENESVMAYCAKCSSLLGVEPVSINPFYSKRRWIFIGMNIIVLLFFIYLNFFSNHPNSNQDSLVSNSNSGNKIIQGILNGNFSDKPINIWLSAEKGDLPGVEIFLSQKIDVNTTNDEGLTPLQVAASFGKTEIVKYLVKEGAKVDLVDEKGNSALLNAVYHDRRDTVKVLADLGADVNLQNKKGDTPLLMAAYYGFDDEFPILLKAGCDPLVKNKNGRTYLEEFKKDYSN